MGEAEAVLSDDKPAESGGSPADESVVWSQEVEVCLFHAMIGHKPVGVNRHFHMICIRDKFSQNIGRQVSSKVIWDHLATMYDMQALDESEILPFPNSEKCFTLPEEIIQEVKEGKLELEQETKEDIKEERDSSAYEEGSTAPARVMERSGSKDKEREAEKGLGDGTADKRKRNRVGPDKVLVSNGNPSSPGGIKRRRT